MFWIPPLPCPVPTLSQFSRHSPGFPAITWKCGLETHLASCLKSGTMTLVNSAGSITSRISSSSFRNITCSASTKHVTCRCVKLVSHCVRFFLFFLVGGGGSWRWARQTRAASLKHWARRMLRPFDVCARCVDLATQHQLTCSDSNATHSQTHLVCKDVGSFACVSLSLLYSFHLVIRKKKRNF